MAAAGRPAVGAGGAWPVEEKGGAVGAGKGRGSTVVEEEEEAGSAAATEPVMMREQWRRHRRPVLATDGVETTPAASAAGEIGTSATAAVLAIAGSVTALVPCVSAGAASPRSTLPRGQTTIQCTCKSCLAQGDPRC